jgi:hypothetical protein
MAVADPRRALTAPAESAPVRDAELRAAIVALERRLAADLAAAFPDRVALPPSPAPGPADGPRVLTAAELERTVADLAGRVAGAPQAAARARLAAMRADPAAHRRAWVTQAALGERGCGAWVVRPRLGLLGRMMGWWRVKLSSGCPLAGAAQAAFAA